MKNTKTANVKSINLHSTWHILDINIDIDDPDIPSLT